MSPGPVLIIVSGPPCTGKTTLARRIAQEFHLPLVTKDGIKELLFDRLGWRDRSWSKQLSLVSYDILYYVIESQLAAGQSLIAESNFNAEVATRTFLALKQKYHFEPLQIQCRTEGEVLLQRFKDRAESGQRHPGHIDQMNVDEFRDVLLKGRQEPLEIGGIVVEVDTTNFQQIDTKRLFGTIRSALSGEMNRSQP